MSEKIIKVDTKVSRVQWWILLWVKIGKDLTVGLEYGYKL